MAKYIKQQMPDLNGKGEDKSYYRIQKYGNVSTDKLLHRICDRGGSGLSRGSVAHVLDTVSEELAYLLASGYSVTIDGFGTFSASIGVREDKEQDTMDGDEVKRNARSLEVKNVTFRSDKELVKEVNRRCELERAGVRRVHRSKYNKEERLQLALDYLSDPAHLFMRIADYVKLTGLSRTAATLELKEFRENPESGLDTSGRGTAKVYIKGTIDKSNE